MSFNLSKKDFLWGFFAQFFSLASGIIILPLVLRLLNRNEIGFNYILLTIGSLVVIFDFGFSNQFSRNITYIFSGVRNIQKEGIDINCIEYTNNIDYKLLAIMIKTAKIVYAVIGIISFIFLITVGTIYIYSVTDKFSSIDNAFFLWILYCISMFFNLYYLYLNTFLIGRGQVTESRKAIIYSRIFYILLSLCLLLFGLGLFGLILANILSPFLQRYLSKKYFFSNDLKKELKKYEVTKTEIKKLFITLWFNAKKQGIVMIGSMAISKSGMFLAGIYLNLDEIASYGLLVQFSSIIVTISCTVYGLYQPKMTNLRTIDSKNKLWDLFLLSMGAFYIIYFILSAVLILSSDFVLKFIGSSTLLPNHTIVIVYLIIVLLENQHSLFATLITTKNSIPFVKQSLISGFFIILFTFLILKFTNLRILGLIIAPGIVQLIYNNWKWPYVVCKEFNMNYLKAVSRSIYLTLSKLLGLFN